ncbi:MAG: aminotransferase class V-fold PLP-dependent enzyme [Acidobacteriaceae bacterium]|nr:aminotransferase class V-fold PLP-dependent enzyme [Acidobacteriaceae bacterium]
MHIYEELGVPAYINANEWYTSSGGSMLPAPVVQAMVEAAQWAVRTEDMLRAAGRAIAELTKNEAACVTSSATAAIVLSVAACMAGFDAKKTEQLPNARGLKKEVIVHRCDHFDEDAAIRIPGARIVEIGDRTGATEEALRGAVNENTAAIFTTPPRSGMIPLETIVRIAHERAVSVIVDIAWSLPPKEHLWTFTREYGADAVLVSGGKGLRGPQGSGLLLGRTALVETCQNMMAPHCRIGRPMKVGRETVAGLYAAVKHFLNGGAEATQEMAEYIAAEMSRVPGIDVRLEKAASHVHLQFTPASTAKRDYIKQQLFEGEPRVLVRNSGPSGIRVNAGTLAEGQERIVAERLKAVLLAL